ncbi:Phosphonates import ATP-binding protein PhnC [Pseudomonas coronafaciens pv. atropurpurea]|nr:Phosphonates import ATP-binding protein PhnC [Pseudomonas coronafaciens pv. atropurpurea]
MCQHALEHNVTLVASLHAVELALAHFARIIGVRDGRIHFDLKASEVERQHLDTLYANEQLRPEPTSDATDLPWTPRC